MKRQPRKPEKTLRVNMKTATYQFVIDTIYKSLNNYIIIADKIYHDLIRSSSSAIIQYDADDGLEYIREADKCIECLKDLQKDNYDNMRNHELETKVRGLEINLRGVKNCLFVNKR